VQNVRLLLMVLVRAFCSNLMVLVLLLKMLEEDTITGLDDRIDRYRIVVVIIFGICFFHVMVL